MATDASPPYRFGDLLALARRSWIRQVRSRMEDAGFAGYRQTDAWVLRLLAQRPWAIGQLGEAMGVTRQAARQLADGMVERGYAAFGTDPQDARRTLVVLTSSGESYARAVAQAQDALNNALRDRVSAADLAAADAVLRAVFGDHARRRVDEAIPPLARGEALQPDRD
jgi:DNA-binding MarR family transcriptional regulator